MPLQRTSVPPGWFPKRGDICLFMLDKKRPALVISSDELNRHALDVCIVPISTVEHKAFRLRLQQLRTAAVALHRSTESVGAEAEVGWRETRRGQFCRRRDGRGAKNGERDYPKSPREERGSHRLREPGGQGRDGWELAARDGVSGIRRGRGWAAETWTDNDTTGAPRPAWKAHIDAPTWSAARQKQNIGRRSPRESG